LTGLAICRMLVLGRLVVGLGIGISAVVVPAYLGEVAPPHLRGRVVEVYEVMLCAGMLCAALGDWALQGLANNWRWMVGVPVLPAIIMAGVRASAHPVLSV
jgi:MFS transporter, SP family, solute carrier family 2 (myo-inositol transporter), member 13